MQRDFLTLPFFMRSNSIELFSLISHIISIDLNQSNTFHGSEYKFLVNVSFVLEKLCVIMYWGILLLYQT